MNENEIKTKLDKLADLRAASDVIAQRKQELIDTILTDEIKDKLKEIDIEFADQFQAVAEQAANLEAEVRTAVIAHGASVKGTFLQAVWNKPRVSWDSKGLSGFAVAHPEINAFMTVGEPSVTLRGVK